jgi:sugar lactone lactonase YvrE
MDTKAVLGEGPRWDAENDRLLWVDIDAGELHLLDPASGADRALPLGSKVCAAAPAAGGTVLAALADRLVLVDPTDGSQRPLARIPHRRSGMRLNDGVCDSAGRFWVGSMAEDEEPDLAALYRLDPDGTLQTVVTGISLSNGIGWSPDERTMYYIDSPTQRVDVFDFDAASGSLAGRRPFIEIPPEDGLPDGLAVDHEGALWVALFGGAKVRRYLPDGTLDRQVDLPTENVTACCLGGPDRRRLFITTASCQLPAERLAQQPLAGSLFALDVDVPGPPASTFAGSNSGAPVDRGARVKHGSL